MDAPAGLTVAMNGAANGKQEQLEERLGYRFAKAELLERALTHSSAIPDLRAAHPADADPSTIPHDNEQLEFLGDAVLDMLASEHLLAAFPDYSEGQLSKSRARIVNARALELAARRLADVEFRRGVRNKKRAGGSWWLSSLWRACSRRPRRTSRRSGWVFRELCEGRRGGRKSGRGVVRLGRSLRLQIPWREAFR